MNNMSVMKPVSDVLSGVGNVLSGVGNVASGTYQMAKEVSGPLGLAASVTFITAKELTLSNPIRKAYEVKESIGEKLYKGVEFATGINNLKDAWNVKKTRDDIELDDDGKKIIVERKVGIWGRLREAGGHLANIPVKGAAWAGLGHGLMCKGAAALGLPGQCNGALSALTTSAVDTVYGLGKFGLELAGDIAKTTAPYIIQAGKEVINNPIPVAGGLFVMNALWSAKNDFEAIDESKDTTEKVMNAAFGLGKLGIAALTTMKLVAYI
jgi:hypothetical protein